MSTRIELELPTLHPLQIEIKNDPARFKVPCLGRRSGKSFLAVDMTATEVLQQNHHVGIFAPTYKLLDDIWRDIIRCLYPIITRKDSQQKRIEFITGSTVDFWTLESPDAGRGRKYHLVVIDEAAMARNLQEAWQNAIRPTLIDFNGKALLCSTPKGKNFYYQMYLRGQDDLEPDWKAWQMPTSCNPHIDESEITTAQKELPQNAFKQEIEAQFIDDGGLVFRNFEACTQGHVESMPDANDSYIIGVDWGKLNDFSVFTVFNATQRRMVEMMRINQLDYLVQSGHLNQLYNKWGCSEVMAEVNSIGEPVIEVLRRQHGMRVTAFKTTNASKNEAIEALALAFENMDITILPNPTLKNELEQFTIERLPSGVYRYAAPEGMHDDTVMSLALAWQSCIRVPKKKVKGFSEAAPMW